MTLLETERLVRKISDLLQQAGNAAMAPKLAEDFAAACHAASLRLQQCEAMIKAGDRPQAIQLAETAPNLLDLVTVLEFRGSDEWRGYCQQNSLPVADRIDARSVQALNECYTQGITTDHPLYASYRSAVLGRKDEEALQTLQSITRLNPADSNAASELARLDAKVLTARLHHLGNSLEETEPVLLVAEIESIEAFGFKSKPGGEAWRKAQTVRCGCLLEEAAEFKKASHWQEALSKLEFIHRLQDEFKLELPAIASKQLGETETWARGEQEKDKKEREFQSLLGELQQRILASEEKDTSARYVKLPELRDDYEAMHKIWRSLTDFTRPIPEAAAANFRKRSVLLEAEIARRTAIQRRLIVAGSLAIFALGAVVIWLVLGQMKTRDFARQLQEAITQRQVHAAERLLERARPGNAGNANLLAAAGTFVARENALRANFDEAFEKLPRQFGNEPDASGLAGIADQLSLARNAFDALAPEAKTENEPRLAAFEGQWQNYLANSGNTVNGLFAQWISSAEKLSGDLDYRAPVDKTSGQLAALAGLVRQMKDCESGFGKNLQLRSDLLERSGALRAKVTAYEGEFKKLADGLAALWKARTLKEFAEGIKLITASEFSTSPAAVAASAIQTLDPSDEAALRFLLGATNASMWAYIEKRRTMDFIPEAVMPAEQQIMEQFNSDPTFSTNLQRYRFWFGQDGSEAAEWITIGALKTSTGSVLSNTVTGRITEHPDDGENGKEITAWAQSASTTVAFTEHRYILFNGHLRLKSADTEWQPVYRFEHVGTTKETAALNSVGLEKVHPDYNSYGKPLLEVLDSIKDTREGSPLFRAYLFLRLVDLMNLQPDAWGLTFCPAVRTHEADIKRIVGEEFNSGDWYVPAKVNAYADKLEKFFASTKPISYAKQAEGLITLARAVSKSGLQYVGFVGLDGKPNFVDNSTSGEVFGYSADGKRPEMMAARAEAGQPCKEPAMPLSPLFACESPRKTYLASAEVNPSDVAFRGALPPLFQAPKRP